MSSNAAKRAREAAIFRAFIAAEPRFAGEQVASWSQPEPDPPDILCETVSGRKVGVELKTWANEAQIIHATAIERCQNAVWASLGPQPKNISEHVAFVRLMLTGRRLRPNESEAFRNELLSFLAEAEESWPTDGSWDEPPGHRHTVFPGRAILTRYVGALQVFPLRHHDRRGASDADHDKWISFPLRAGAYSEREMMEPLIDLLHASWAKYEDTRAQKALDELHLLIHYDSVALLYCTPVETPFFDFGEAAKGALSQVRMRVLLQEPEPPPFDRVFLFVAITDHERIFRVSP